MESVPGAQAARKVGEFANGRVALGKARDDGPARRIGKGRKDMVQVTHLTDMLIK